MKEVTYEVFQKKAREFYKHYDYFIYLRCKINYYIQTEWLNTFCHWLLEHLFPKQWQSEYTFSYYYIENGEHYPEEKEFIGKKITNGLITGVIKRIRVYLDDIYYEVETHDGVKLMLTYEKFETL